MKLPRSDPTLTGAWAVGLAAFVALPVVAYVRWGRAGDGPWTTVSAGAGLAGLAMLIAAFVLPSRIRLLSGHLGVETLLRAHRGLAVAGAALVGVHVALAVGHHGTALLDLPDAPPRVWAAWTATLALALTVVLSASRRRRRPRYEGWRLAHLAMAWTVLAAAGLHVLLLGRLVDRPATRWWLAGDLALLVFVMAYRWVWRPLRAAGRSYTVTEIRDESPTAVSVVLTARGHKGLQFRPGQFAWLKIGSSPFVFEEHPFTVSSSADQPGRKQFTFKALGDFSQILAGLRPGRRVYLDGPHGRFTTDGLRAAGFVFIAGGVGITPMLAMLRTLAERADPRPLLLIVGGRTAEELLHRAEVRDLREHLQLVVIEVLEDAADDWVGENGRVTRALLDRHLPTGTRQRRRLAYFVCGPPPMVAGTVTALHALDIPRRRIHTELFDLI